MSNAQAIGGYFELDGGGGRTPLPEGVLLNSGRNALRHIVRQLGIHRLHVPYYTCPVVWHALKAEGCELEFYEIGLDLKPRKPLAKNDFVLYTNYFGCCGGIVDELTEEYPNLIVDNAQAYCATPKGRASFSSPRKFFGVPDGGIAYGVGFKPQGDDYPLDDSRDRMLHLELRKRGEIAKGYDAFKEAELSLDGIEIRRMSPDTRRLLEHVAYDSCAAARISNFEFLDGELHTSLQTHRAQDDVPMVYPYLTRDSGLRQRLIANNIFVATYWSGLGHCGEFCEAIIPLPIDQRYGLEHMKRIIGVIR